jgi:hypothetical protein
MILKATALFAIEVPDDADPETIAASFDNGLWTAVGGFPDGDVISATVETITQATEQEIQEQGWSE